MLVSLVSLIVVHQVFHDVRLTVAAGLTLAVFGATLVRVEIGLYVLILMMLLSPEISGGQVGDKQLQLNVRYNDILIFAVFLGVTARIAWEGREYYWIPSPVNAPLLLYFGVCVFSTALALRRALGYFDEVSALFTLAKMAEYYMVFFLVGNALKSSGTIKLQLGLFFAVAVVISIFGIGQIGEVSRVSSPFEQGGSEPNTLGGYLLLVMTLAIALAVNAPYLRYKLMFGLLFGIALIPFLYTLSRASYLGLLFALITLSLRARRAILLGLVLLTLSTSFMLMPKEVRERVNYTFQEGSGKEVEIGGIDLGVQVDTSTFERIHVWRKVWFNMRWAPWLGGGVSWGMVLDSQYARVVFETGIIGVAAFVMLQWRILKTANQTYSWSSDWVDKGVSLAVFAATVGLIVHSFGTISFLIARIMEPYWYLVAVVAVRRFDLIEAYRARKHAQAALQRAAAEKSAPAQGQGNGGSPDARPAPAQSLGGWRS